MLARVGAGLWIARIMLTWGLVSAAMAFVQDATTFYVLRFLLGAAEAGFFPGIIYYLTQWFPARERARAVALFMTGTAIAGVIGGPLSSALLLLDGTWGLRGWQWLFVVEGLPAVLWRRSCRRAAQSAASHRDVADRRRAPLAGGDARGRAGVAAEVHGTMRAAFASGRLWALASIYFSIVLAIYGVSFWLPQILGALGHRVVGDGGLGLGDLRT